MEKGVIESTVADGIQPGDNRIGRLVGNNFYVIYVGRADDREDRGLKDRLIEHIGEWPGDLYFNWLNELDIEDAFNRECEDYHKWKDYEGKLENGVQPRKPDGNTKITCPVCGQ